MRLVEWFISFQGEGKFAGRLSFFIRLAGCNLRCAGFGCEAKSPKTGEILKGCDTIRAVATEHFESYIFDGEFLLNEIKKLPSKPLIIITGGEPLLNASNSDLASFLEAVLAYGCEVQFETNGTLAPDFASYPLYQKCHFAISVKLKNSGEPLNKRFKPAALNELFKNAKCFYKFVVSGDGDSEISEIKEILSVQDGEVWLMAKSAGLNELNKNAPKVAAIALKNGFNYSDRVHLRLNIN